MLIVIVNNNASKYMRVIEVSVSLDRWIVGGSTDSRTVIESIVQYIIMGQHLSTRQFSSYEFEWNFLIDTKRPIFFGSTFSFSLTWLTKKKQKRNSRTNEEKNHVDDNVSGTKGERNFKYASVWKTTKSFKFDGKKAVETSNLIKRYVSTPS